MIEIDGKRKLVKDAYRLVGGASENAKLAISLFDSPIIIAGCPRTRTSFTTLALKMLGYWTGKTRAPDNRNPVGYYENSYIFRLGSHGWLPKMNGVILKAPFIDESKFDDDFVSYHRSMVLSSMLVDEWDIGKWVIKDPSYLISMEGWRHIFPNYRLIICDRRKSEVFSSMERFYTRASKYEITQSMDVFYECKEHLERTQAHRVLTVNTDRLVALHKPELERLAKFLGEDDMALAIAAHNSLSTKKEFDLRKKEAMVKGKNKRIQSTW